MFTVFKPRGGRLKAAQVNLENLQELTVLFHGRLVYPELPPREDRAVDDEKPVPVGFEYPTFDGVTKVLLGDYVVDDDSYYIVKRKDFEDKYEPARVVNRDDKS